MKKTAYKHLVGGGRLLQNEDEAEVRHLQRLLEHPPPWAGKEIKVVTWIGGWLCLCGRVCWPKQHCKNCGQLSPCRDWCFKGGCARPGCRYPHPSFLLPATMPAMTASGRSVVDDRELLRLVPPGSRPAPEVACEGRGQRARDKEHKRVVMVEAKSKQSAAMGAEGGWPAGGIWPPPGPAESARAGGWDSVGGAWPAGEWDGGSAVPGEQGAAVAASGNDIWADLVARARASMPHSVHSSAVHEEPAENAVSHGSSQGATPAAVAVAEPAMAQHGGHLGTAAVDPGTVDWTGLLGGAKAHTHSPRQEQQDSELELLLAQLCTT